MAFTEQLVRVGTSQFPLYEAQAEQASVAAYAVCGAITFDMAPWRSIQLSMRAESAGITFGLYGAGEADFTDEVLAYEWAVAAANTDHESVPTVRYRYYRLKIKSTVSGSPGNAVVKAIASQNEANEIYWDDQAVSVGSLGVGAVPADVITFGPSGATRPKTYGFAVGEDMDGSLQFSHRYREFTDISFHVHWAPTVATGGYVKWELSYYWLNYETNQAAVGDPVSIVVEQQAVGIAWSHQIAAFPDISGVGKEISSIIMFKIKRIASAGTAHNGDAAFLSADAHFQVDAPGSRMRSEK